MEGIGLDDDGSDGMRYSTWVGRSGSGRTARIPDLRGRLKARRLLLVSSGSVKSSLVQNTSASLSSSPAVAGDGEKEKRPRNRFDRRSQ